MDKDRHSISVIMPAYNEEPDLEDAVARTCETFRSLALDFEVIIVNDHSADRTGAIADKLAAERPDVHAYHHETNLGAGGAFRTGVAHATKDYVIFIPVDNPLEPEDVEAYLPRIGTCDIVVGVRDGRVGYTPFTRFGSFMYSRVLLPLFFNLGISDPNWIQAYRRSIFTEQGIRIDHPGMFFVAEILIQARRKRLLIAEVPARMRPRPHGKPTCFRLSAMWKTFRAMLAFFWQTRTRRDDEQRPS